MSSNLPQMVDQPGRLPAELRVIRRVAAREHVAGAEAEVHGHRRFRPA